MPTKPYHLRDVISQSDIEGYKKVYAFFALKQQQRIPYLPIHTEAEKLLFIKNVGKYLGGGPTAKRLTSASSFDCIQMAEDWVDGKLSIHGSVRTPSVEHGIFKKTPNHLNSFYKVFLLFILKLLNLLIIFRYIYVGWKNVNP